MSATDVVREFWAKSRWGDRWGVTRIVNGKRTNPHRGHDVKYCGGKPVPALRAGRVVLVSELKDSRILGYHVVLDVGDDFDYYCHLRTGTRPNVGDWIDVGESVGIAADWGDFTGSAWSGPHVHFGSGPNIRSVYEGATHNATKIVEAALTRIGALKPSAGEIKEIIMELTKDNLSEIGQTIATWPIAKTDKNEDIPLWQTLRETHKEVAQDLSRPSVKSALEKVKDTVAGNARNAVAIIADVHRIAGEILAAVGRLEKRPAAAVTDEQVAAALDARLDVLAELVAQKFAERVANGPAPEATTPIQ